MQASIALKSQSITNTRQTATPQKRKMPLWIRLFPWATLIIGYSIAAFCWFMGFKVPHEAGTEMQARLVVVSEVLFATIGMGGGILFLAGLHGFKFRLRIAYIFIALGAILYGLGELNVPAIPILGLSNSFYGLYGGIMLPGLLSVISILIGISMFGKLINAKKLPLVTIIGILLLGAAVELVSYATGQSIQNIQHPGAGVLSQVVVNSLLILYAVLMTFTTIKILYVKKTAGTAYTNSLAWLAVACGMQAFGTWQTVIGLALQLGDTPYFTLSLFVAPFVFSSYLFLKAGYNFTKITNV